MNTQQPDWVVIDPALYAELCRREAAYNRFVAALREIAAIYDDGNAVLTSAECEQMADAAKAALMAEGEAIKG